MSVASSNLLVPDRDRGTEGPVSRFVPRRAPRAVRVVARTFDHFVRDEMATYSAALAYRGLVALFPFVIFVTAVVNLLGVARLLDMLGDWARMAPEGRVPTAIREWAVAQARGRAGGAVLSFGAVAAIWAVASGARVLRTALNVAAGIPERHPAWLRVAISFVVAPVLGTVVLAVLALFTITRGVLLRAAAWFEMNEIVVAVWDWVRMPVGIALAALMVAALYIFAASERQPFRAVLPGAILTAVVWAAATAILTKAAAGVLQFGVTYGSFSAAIVLLIYLYVAAAGLLFGAGLNAVLSGRR